MARAQIELGGDGSCVGCEVFTPAVLVQSAGHNSCNDTGRSHLRPLALLRWAKVPSGGSARAGGVLSPLPAGGGGVPKAPNLAKSEHFPLSFSFIYVIIQITRKMGSGNRRFWKPPGFLNMGAVWLPKPRRGWG